MDPWRTSIALKQVIFQVISQKHAKLKTTLDVFYCNCERFTAPHNLYVKMQVLKKSYQHKIPWNVIEPLALSEHFLILSV